MTDTEETPLDRARRMLKDAFPKAAVEGHPYEAWALVALVSVIEEMSDKIEKLQGQIAVAPPIANPPPVTWTPPLTPAPEYITANLVLTMPDGTVWHQSISCQRYQTTYISFPNGAALNLSL